MVTQEDPQAVVNSLNKVRQYRQFRPDPLPEETLATLLEIARWTGSSRNTQPWQFIAITDKAQLQKLSALREAINWIADAPAGIAIVLDGTNPTSESYDEGRVTERLLIGAHLLGLGGGIGWFGDDAQQQQAKEILGVPAAQTARAVVALGYVNTSRDPRPNRATGGRKPLADIASHNRLGEPFTA